MLELRLSREQLVSQAETIGTLRAELAAAMASQTQQEANLSVSGQETPTGGAIRGR